MTPREFMRRRAKIERRPGSQAKRDSAMAHLVREAGAAVIVRGGRIAGWRMKSGEVVCAKQRFRDQAAADLELLRIQAVNWSHHRIPTRAYSCPHCRGWHLTSQPAQREHAA